MLVLIGGRAQVISGIAERCAAVIQAWYPGEEGGHAVADILYGKVSPSAKLSVSYPNTEVYEPLCYNLSTEKDPRVQWPFGYGLSYTTFEYKDLKVEGPLTTDASSVDISFKVKNTGEMTADEITQIYISPGAANIPIRPIQLQGFARVHLQPGETKTVSVELDSASHSFFDASKHEWTAEPGRFDVLVGSSSSDIRGTVSFNLK